MLAGGVRPIVLLRKQADAGMAGGVAPGNGYLGVMLPYTPLHELLFCDLGNGAPPDVLVMTSGNLSEEPIAWRDEDAVARLSYVADAFLLHDRPIHAPCDDSVVRIFEGREMPVRRARGYAPMPILLPLLPESSRDRSGLALLATGADLKSTFCLTQGQHAILSQHIGDMGNVETYEAFTRAVEHLQGLFRIRPEVLACDAHPGYLSTRWAQEHADGRQVIAVQHHHAHIAALMAEQAAATAASDEPVIGFSFDGTGYGSDGAIWGGEVLLATYSSFARRAHLRYLPLPGGDSAVRRPYRTALAHLWAAGAEWAGSLPPVQACPSTELALLRRQLETGLNCVATSSMGRLCDAVAALAGVCQTASYEAQAAIELEALVDSNALAQIDELGDNGYAFRFLDDDDVTIVDPAPLIRQVAADVQSGRPAGWIATQFPCGAGASDRPAEPRCACSNRDRAGCSQRWRIPEHGAARGCSECIAPCWVCGARAPPCAAERCRPGVGAGDRRCKATVLVIATFFGQMSDASGAASCYSMTRVDTPR